MQLRRLIINGFKTFAGKSEFEFREGITAVVGPNGSGKSNLSDAIRWVLGEQSARLLRGTSMADVIFAGTNSRKPSSMAEVTAVIENSDRALSLDFDEVSVTRRVYRDGESQFLINGVECRLKDIAELFAGTGLGKEAYASIEQGKVDAIISSQPLDRRGIFDEASGIQRYKNRKREAERKLADVGERAERASEVLADLKEKEPVLECQANDASLYRQITEELKSTELKLISIDTMTAYRRMLRHGNLLENRRNERQRLDGDLAVSEARLEEVKLRSEKISLELESSNSEAQAASRMALKHQMRSKEVRNEIEAVREKIASALRDIIKGESEALDLSRDIEHYREERNRLSILAEEAVGMLDESAKELESLRNREMALEEKAEAFRSEHFELAAETASIRNSISKLKDRIEACKSKGQRIEEQIQAKEKELENEKARSGLLSHEAESQKSEAESKEVRAVRLQEEKSRHEAEAENLRKQHLVLYSALEGDKAVLSALLGLEAVLEGYSSSAKAVLKAQKDGSIDGIIGICGELLCVPAGLELAIDSALGFRVNDIICCSSEKASMAIDYLKSSRQGRATFLPLDSLVTNRGKRDERLDSCKGFLGYANDLVRCEGTIKKALDYQLGSTAVFGCLGDALDVQRKGIRIKSVTKDGEIVSSGGAITGGQKKDSSQSVIVRKARAAELEESIESGLAKAGEIEGALSKIGILAQEKGEELSSCIESIRSLRKAIDELTGEAVRSSAIRTSLEEKILQLEEELSDIKKDEQTSSEEADKLQGKLKAAEHALSEHEISNATDRKLKEEISAKLSEISAKVTEHSVSKATTEAKLKALLDRIGEHEEKQKKIAYDKSILLAAQASLEKSIEPLMALEKQEASAAGRYEIEAEDMSKRIDALRTARDESSAEIAEAEQSVKAKRRRLQHLAEAESEEAVEKARASGEFNVLSSKLEQEFGVAFNEGSFNEGDAFNRESAICRIEEIKSEISGFENLNLAAAGELLALREKSDFMQNQLEDLEKARVSLTQVIREAERTARKQFKEMLELIRENFKELFSRLFQGGIADIVLTDDEEPLESGIEIICRPPGKKLSQLSLLSGGEKALAAIALIFAFLKARPAPFCILDEIDAALDDANVDRFKDLVTEFADRSQMIIISHRRRTMETACRVYGVTMEETGVSKAVCVDISEIMFQEGLVE